VLIESGYHPVAAPLGYAVCYGSCRGKPGC